MKELQTLHKTIGNSGLYNCDCLFGMGAITPGSVDVVVTSPPYNIGTEYIEYDDRKSTEQYLAWLTIIFKNIYAVLSDEGSFFLNIASKPTMPLLPFKVLQLADFFFHVQNVIHWIKSIATPKGSMGHYKPINSPRYLNQCHEYIFHLTKSGTVSLNRKAVGVPYQDASNAKRWENGSDGIRCRGNTWFIPYDTTQKKKDHPATFPVQLPEMCLKLHGLNQTNLVLDPFMGIGTTGMACARHNIRFIGFEIEREYWEVACKKICQIEKQKKDEGVRG